MATGLVLVVPELTEVVDRWRLPTVPSAAAGGPVHVTALYPWAATPTENDLEKLATVLDQIPPITLTLDRLERFAGGVLYLALAPDAHQACRQLTTVLMDAFPECIPYHGEHPDPHPHVTVAMGTDQELDVIEAEMGPVLAAVLPLEPMIGEVTVMERRPDGCWYQGHRLGIGRPL